MGGPTPHHFLGIGLTAILAFILLVSSLTMVLALAATERNDQRGTRIWLAATILLGLTFLGGQVYEFRKLWSEHFVTVTETRPDGEVVRHGVAEHDLEHELKRITAEAPAGAKIEAGSPKPVTWTTSIFGSTFFTMTGFHGTHVAIGVIWLSIVLAMSFRGAISARNSLTVEMAGLYWHFVDLVWVAIFTLIYLI
jgi:cytochrome c oxidase subunit 3/cytochrome o ubiquinol oxidase subunit 3